jgi:hypothetical protein
LSTSPWTARCTRCRSRMRPGSGSRTCSRLVGSRPGRGSGTCPVAGGQRPMPGTRISSVSNGKSTAPPQRHGARETWTYGLFLSRGTGGTGAIGRTPMGIGQLDGVTRIQQPPGRAWRSRPPKSQPKFGHFLCERPNQPCEPLHDGQLPRNLRLGQDTFRAELSASRWSCRIACRRPGLLVVVGLMARHDRAADRARRSAGPVGERVRARVSPGTYAARGCPAIPVWPPAGWA